MGRNLFVNIPLPKVMKTSSYNPINGNDAESLAVGKLLSALGCETRSSSRNEDNKQIDLLISYDHPWYIKDRLIIAAQVKSGNSFGRINKIGFVLYSRAKTPSIKSVHPMLIVWIDTNSYEAYWAFIHSNTKTKSQEYGSHHKVCPPMRYDLARCHSRFLGKKTGGQGIIVANLKDKFPINRKAALGYYKKLKKFEVISPCLGQIEFTNLGWRHMFRMSRSTKNKNQSLLTIFYLDKILVQYPSKIIAANAIDTTRQGYNYRYVEYNLSYDKVKVFNSKTNAPEDISVKIRVIEEIRYNDNWEKNNSSQLIQRKLILLSCYFKKRE